MKSFIRIKTSLIVIILIAFTGIMITSRSTAQTSDLILRNIEALSNGEGGGGGGGSKICYPGTGVCIAQWQIYIGKSKK